MSGLPRAAMPALLLLTISAVAHAQGTMDFSGAQTLMGTFNYIQLYHGNASLLAESLEVIMQAASIILGALEPSVELEETVTNHNEEPAELAEVA